MMQRAVDIGAALMTNKLYALSLIGYSVLQLLIDEIKATDFFPVAPPA